MTTARKLANMKNLYSDIVESVPKLKRGKVWCRRCGHSQDVDSAQCLRNGWPLCCGHTMTIDAPWEGSAA